MASRIRWSSHLNTNGFIPKRQIMRSVLLVSLALVSLRAFATPPVKTTSLEYADEKAQAFEGLMTSPHGKIKGGVLLVHNWMGISEETKKQAERYAQLGYLVLSADIYGKGQRPKDSNEAAQFAGRYKSDRALFRERLNLALATLRNRPDMVGLPIFAAGYCFGGTGVIELARSGADLKAVFSFHGGLDAPNPKEETPIRAQVIAFHGAADPFVKPEDLAAFEKEMADRKVDWRLMKFGGAVHSFTDQGAGSDPSKGAAYDAKADERSWALTESILSE